MRSTSRRSSYLEEIQAAAVRHPTLRTHILYTGREGFLTAERTVQDASRIGNIWVYMCGPPPMMTALARGFRGLGTPASHVRWEQFGIR